MLRRVRGLGRAKGDVIRRKLIASADAARDSRQWREAAQGYTAALKVDAANAALHVQLGHALKEDGDGAAAEACYRAALELQPDQSDTWVQLGHVLKLLGRSGEAVDAYREALLKEPALASAKKELIALGAREMIPDEGFESGLRGAEFAAAVVTLREAGRRFEEGVRLAAYPTRSFNDFRHSFPVLAPPATVDRARAGTMAIFVDGRDRSAAEIKITLESLLGQSDPDWCVHVAVDPLILDHPVASMAMADHRIMFGINRPNRPVSGMALFLGAGTVLDRYAVAWFAFTHARTGCAAAYSDHDCAEEAWRGPRLHFEPVLQPQFDPHWFGSGLTPPAVIMICEVHKIHRLHPNSGRALCDVAAAGGRIMHVPRLLATVVDVKTPLMNAPADLPAKARSFVPLGTRNGVRTGLPSSNPLAVIIPTRDKGEFLARAIETIREKASNPGRIEVIVANNRSSDHTTLSLLARLENSGVIRVLPFDEPFNWSRVNNMAIARAKAQHLVLLNNDTEMLTQGWDELVLERLARPGVGLVGGRLLFPDRTVQHAGILFGMGDGSPVHEGLGARESECGPLGRWLRTRSVAAVTGAFMAFSRETWLGVGGFDELQLPLGYSDVDMCLKVRSRALDVLYEPEITLLHHESKTRGKNVTRSQIAWDRAELRVMHARWGDALFHDRTANPHWGTHGRPFDCYRDPPVTEVVAYLDGAFQLGAAAIPDAGLHHPSTPLSEAG